MILIPDELEKEFTAVLHNLMRSYAYNPDGSDYTCVFCGAGSEAEDVIVHRSDCLGQKLATLEFVDVVIQE